MSKQLKVLFIHGLKGQNLSHKPKILNSYFDVRAIPMHNTWNLPMCLYEQIKAIKQYEPDVIVGSSYGAALLLIILQMDQWKGPCVLLSQALGLIAPWRMWLPKENNMPIIFVHGTLDKTCNIKDTYLLADRNKHIKIMEVIDGHNLHNTLDNLLPELVKQVSEENQTITCSEFSDWKIWFMCWFVTIQIIITWIPGMLFKIWNRSKL